MRKAKWLIAALGLAVLTTGCVESGGYYPNTAYNSGYYQGSGYYPSSGTSRSQRYWDSSRRDYDRDGIPNRYDRDANGDGVPDRYQGRAVRY